MSLPCMALGLWLLLLPWLLRLAPALASALLVIGSRPGVPGTAQRGWGKGGTWAAHCVGLGPVLLGAHTLRIPAGCVKPLLRLGFRRKRRVFATCATASA